MIFKKILAIICFSLITINVFSLNIFVRNSSSSKMQIRLLRKSDKTVVFANEVPKNRTVEITNLKKQAYILYYKNVKNIQWRIMDIIVLRPNKTFVLF